MQIVKPPNLQTNISLWLEATQHGAIFKHKNTAKVHWRVARGIGN